MASPIPVMGAERAPAISQRKRRQQPRRPNPQQNPMSSMGHSPMPLGGVNLAGLGGGMNDAQRMKDLAGIMPGGFTGGAAGIDGAGGAGGVNPISPIGMPNPGDIAQPAPLDKINLMGLGGGVGGGIGGGMGRPMPRPSPFIPSAPMPTAPMEQNPMDEMRRKFQRMI